MNFTFLITARNAISFAERCIDSIRQQKGRFSFDWIYVDDASEYCDSEKAHLMKLLDHRVLFLQNRHFQIGAIARGIQKIRDPNTIVCLIDGDDYLLSDALSHVAQAYENSDVAMSYGNVLLDFRPYQNLQVEYFTDKMTVNTVYSDEIWEKRLFRQDGFRCFHLRTFRRWLWDFIDSKGFYRKDSTPIRASGDSAYVFPMLELLAEKQHVAFIEKPIYVYRLHNGNVHNHDKISQSQDLNYLRFTLPSYDPLDRDLLRRYLQQSSMDMR